MADLNGDGVTDVIESRYVSPENLISGTAVHHFYYLMANNNTSAMNANSIPPGQSLFASSTSGRSVDVGQIFGASKLPDIVHGLEDGRIRLFANLGVDKDDESKFLGFNPKDILQVQTGCSIRDIKAASLSPCTVSLIAAVTCGTGCHPSCSCPSSVQFRLPQSSLCRLRGLQKQSRNLVHHRLCC